MRERTLSMHVERKLPLYELPRDQRVPSELHGFRTDVVAVGRPHLQSAVDTDQLLLAAYDDLKRNSAIAVVSSSPSGGVQALGSGHGLLPIEGGQFVSGAWTPTDNKTISVVGQEQPRGSLAFGAIGNDADYAVATFPTLDPSTMSLGHTLAKVPPPLRIRASDASLEEKVHHLAAARGFPITGTVAWLPIAGGKITLVSEAGIDVTYENVFGVTCESIPFSIAAESGSTVFDASGRVVGFVVGAGRDPDDGREVSYVLSNVPALRSVLGAHFPLFFTEVF